MDVTDLSGSLRVSYCSLEVLVLHLRFPCCVTLSKVGKRMRMEKPTATPRSYDPRTALPCAASGLSG
jgi:hypothetical protein